MKYYRTSMGAIENWIWFNQGNLKDHRSQWTQQPGHWTIFFLEHAGGFSINNRVTPFEDGYVALVAPGTKAGFLRTGEGTPHYAATFGIAPRVESVALPSLVDLGEFRELRRAEFAHADNWLDKSIGRALSCIFNLLWSIAQPLDVLRSSDLMYDFERLVSNRMAEKLTVASIARELDISTAQLLRSVRAEYNQTPQQFLKEKRAETGKTLIVTTDLPLKAIAARVGMSDLQYFNKAIRATSGLSPRALRDLAQNQTQH